MRKFEIRFCFIILALCFGICTLNAQSDTFEKATALISDSEKELLEEFRQTAPKVQSFYTNMQIEAELSWYRKQKIQGKAPPASSKQELPLTGHSQLTFYVADGLWTDDTLKSYYRLDEAYYGNQEVLDTPENEWMEIAGPESSYSINKIDKTTYVLTRQEKTTDDALSRHFFSVPFHFSPYAISGIPITRWLFEVDGSEVQSVTVEKSSPENPDEIVTVMFRKSNTGGKGYTNFECRFIRNKSWALQYVKRTTGAKPANHENGFIIRNRYEGEADGVPLLTQSTYETFYGLKGTDSVNQRKVYDITKIVPGAPKLAVFDVQQFLPAIGRATRLNYLRVFFMVAGAALIFIAVYLKCYGK